MSPTTRERLVVSIRRFIVLLAMMILGFGANAQDDRRIFTSFGIEVDVRAATAAQAREQALAQAEGTAFRILIRKLAGEERAFRLPSQSPAQIRSMVRSLEVVEERSSATRYIATFNIAFDPDRIRQLFGLARIRFSELGSEPVLLLPLLVHAGGRSISGDDNPWYHAWQAADTLNRLYDYRMPEDGNGSQTYISARMVDLNYDPESLSKLAADLGASDVLIARTRIDRPDARSGQDVTAAFEYLSRPGDVERIRVRVRPGENFQQAMTRLANAYLDRADSRWRARTVLTFGESFSLQARVTLTNIEDWAEIRAALLRTPIIREVRVDRLSLPVSWISLRYVGGAEQLRLSLDQEGLALTERNPGRWWIVRAEAQTAAQTGEENRQ